MVKDSGTLAIDAFVCDSGKLIGAPGGGSKCIVAVIVCATVALRVGLSKEALVDAKTSTFAVATVLPRDGGDVAVMVAVPNPTAVTSNALPIEPAGTSTHAGTGMAP